MLTRRESHVHKQVGNRWSIAGHAHSAESISGTLKVEHSRPHFLSHFTVFGRDETANYELIRQTMV